LLRSLNRADLTDNLCLVCKGKLGQHTEEKFMHCIAICEEGTDQLKRLLKNINWCDELDENGKIIKRKWEY
jgi:ferredoxin